MFWYYIVSDPGESGFFHRKFPPLPPPPTSGFYLSLPVLIIGNKDLRKIKVGNKGISAKLSYGQGRLSLRRFSPLEFTVNVLEPDCESH